MPTPATLVTLGQFKDALKITHAFADTELQRTLDDAEDVIRTVLKTGDDPTWTSTTVPGAIRAAILRQAVFLSSDRGDRASTLTPDGLAPFVEGLLTPYRDPALA
jgi:hypothetical protein